MPIFSRTDALESHIFFKSYQLLRKVLEHNVYKINISLDVLYLMQTANLYIFTGNLKGKIVQKVQAMKKYIKYPKYDAFYNTCVAALDNKYRYTTLTNTDTVAKQLALQVSNVRDPGSIPGARDPIFLPRIKIKRIISSVPAATSLQPATTTITDDNLTPHTPHVVGKKFSTAALFTL